MTTAEDIIGCLELVRTAEKNQSEINCVKDYVQNIH